MRATFVPVEREVWVNPSEFTVTDVPQTGFAWLRVPHYRVRAEIDGKVQFSERVFTTITTAQLYCDKWEAKVNSPSPMHSL